MGLGSNDEDILRLNEEIGLIPEERLRAAQVRRRQRAVEGDSPPDILELLALEGEISPEVERRYRERLAAIELPGAPRTPLPPEVIEAQRHSRNRFGHFVLIREVGRGGMGTVHRAWDTRVGRIVALKIILGSSPEAVDRFVREARIAGRLQHPAIATVYEAGEAAGRHYIAMQFIEGQPIDKIPRPMDQVLRLVRDAARALHYAHGEGIVHRDVKPGNMLVDGDGRVYVTDFGTAKEFSKDSTSQLSYTSTIIGTPQYMSPEQIQSDSKRVDARSDVYSLGATLFALIAGRPPFDDPNIGQILVAVMRQPAPSVCAHNLAASPELDASIQRTLAKDPGKRYKSAQHFADELDRLVRDGRYKGRYGLAKLLAKRWLPRIALALLAVALIRLGLLALTRPNEVVLSWDQKYAGLYARYESWNGEPEPLRAIIKAVEEDRVLKDQIHARVLRASALYDLGDLDGASKALAKEDKPDGDYRISYLRALEELELETHREPPLPSVGGPAGEPREWIGTPPAWPDKLRSLFEAPFAIKNAGTVSAEFEIDQGHAKAILAMMDGRLGSLATLADKHKHGRVLRKALRRARYIAGRFDEVHNDKDASRRERAGALLADNQYEPNKLSHDLADDPQAEAVRLAILARASVDAGRDPADHVTAGLAIPEVHQEVRASLLATHARWLLLSGQEASAVEACLKALGDDPPETWLGKLALAEARLVRGTARVRNGDRANGEADLRAVEDASFLVDQRSWLLARAIRGEAQRRIRRSVATRFDEPTAGPAYERALLNYAAVLLRDRGTDWAAFDKALKDLLEVHPTHPEAFALRGRGHLERSRSLKDAVQRARSLTKALQDFDLALRHAPRHIEAMYGRAYSLCYLGRHAEAIETADQILDVVPGHAGALETRGDSRYVLGDYAGAVADFKAALALEPDSELLPDSLKMAERMLARKKP